MLQGVPTIGGAFQDGLLKTTKATSENQEQQLPNKTVSTEHPSTQASNLGPAPAKLPPSNAQLQAPHGPGAAQPQNGIVQEVVKPVTGQPSQNSMGHQVDTKPVADVSQKAPVLSQSSQAIFPAHQTTADGKPGPLAATNGQPLKEVTSQQPIKQAPHPEQQQISAPAQAQSPPAQPQVAVQSKPAVSNSFAPTQHKPTTPAVHTQMKQQQQQMTLAINKQRTHPQPTHRPTAAATSKGNRFVAQLATVTRPENIHRINPANAAPSRPTPPALVTHQQAVMQHFHTKGKYRDEE